MRSLSRVYRRSHGLVKRLLSTAAVPQPSGQGTARWGALSSTSPKLEVYLSTSTDPFFNLATQMYMFDHSGFNSHPKHTLFLWRNEPCAVIGRFQNARTAAFISRLWNDGVTLVRRRTAGDGVYLDMGNSNFAFDSSPKQHADIASNTNILLSALKTRFGIVGVPSSGEIATLDGRTFCGTACRYNDSKVVHSGTVFLDVNLQRRARYHVPHPTSLVNLKTIAPEITHENFCQAMVNAFASHYGVDPPSTLSQKSGVCAERTQRESANADLRKASTTLNKASTTLKVVQLSNETFANHEVDLNPLHTAYVNVLKDWNWRYFGEM